VGARQCSAPLGRRRPAAATFVGQAEHLGPGVLPAPPALKETFAHQARDDLGQGEAVDAGALLHVGLVQALVLGDCDKDCQLARGDEAQGVGGKSFSAACSAWCSRWVGEWFARCLRSVMVRPSDKAYTLYQPTPVGERTWGWAVSRSGSDDAFQPISAVPSCATTP
jgi:hypothetical protein